MGIIDGSGESLDDLVSIYTTVIINYATLEELDRSSAAGGTDAVARAKRHAEAVTAAVFGLAQTDLAEGTVGATEIRALV